jgi:hypothetical protein
LDAVIGLFILSTTQTQLPLLNIQTIVATDKNFSDEKCECDICYEKILNTNIVKLNCNHELCKECVKTIIKTCKKHRKDINCAFCREKTFTIETKSDEIKMEMDSVIY